jgi:hypothetical protein
MKRPSKKSLDLFFELPESTSSIIRSMAYVLLREEGPKTQAELLSQIRCYSFQLGKELKRLEKKKLVVYDEDDELYYARYYQEEMETMKMNQKFGLDS